MPDFGRGYVTDIPYTRSFFRELAPAWLDLTATIGGVAPPDCGPDLGWCELGCGQGVTAAVLAATHPQGRFVGIDLMPEHIAHARRLAAEGCVTNVSFHAADFSAVELDPAGFDYIVAHGVYAWVDAAAQAALHRLIDRHLRPHGLVYVSYNAMPGWAADVPLQRLLLRLGADLPGDSLARFKAAVELMGRLRAAGAPSLQASPIARQIDDLLSTHPPAYLAHEYMNAHWQPLFVTEVRAAMAGIGLVPAGTASLAENFDSFVLRRAEREALAAIGDSDGDRDADRRELVRDYLLDQRFRRDVYSRDGHDLDDAERRRRLLAMRYALAQPAAAVDYSTSTGAGRVSFDNRVARAIVAALAEAPMSGGALARSGIEQQDAIANLLTLCCAGAVRPAAMADASVAPLNRAIARRIGGSEEIEHMALSSGTAVRLDPGVRQALSAAPAAAAEPAVAEWLHFLRRFGDVG